MNYKRFHKSDNLLFLYNRVEYPIPTTDTFNFRRDYVVMRASPNVTWQDIAKEIHDISKNLALSSPHLSTCRGIRHLKDPS